MRVAPWWSPDDGRGVTDSSATRHAFLRKQGGSSRLLTSERGNGASGVLLRGMLGAKGFYIPANQIERAIES